MKKRAQDTPERSPYDTFCTSRSKDIDELRSRMIQMIKLLQKHEFKVWRYKIESTVEDSRYEDVEKLLT